MTKSEKQSASIRKEKAEKTKRRKGKKPIYVKTYKKAALDEVDTDTLQYAEISARKLVTLLGNLPISKKDADYLRLNLVYQFQVSPTPDPKFFNYYTKDNCIAILLNLQSKLKPNNPWKNSIPLIIQGLSLATKFFQNELQKSEPEPTTSINLDKGDPHPGTSIAYAFFPKLYRLVPSTKSIMDLFDTVFSKYDPKQTEIAKNMIDNLIEISNIIESDSYDNPSIPQNIKDFIKHTKLPTNYQLQTLFNNTNLNEIKDALDQHLNTEKENATISTLEELEDAPPTQRSPILQVAKLFNSLTLEKYAR
jgi:hypothetical protein